MSCAISHPANSLFSRFVFYWDTIPPLHLLGWLLLLVHLRLVHPAPDQIHLSRWLPCPVALLPADLLRNEFLVVRFHDRAPSIHDDGCLYPDSFPDVPASCELSTK